MGVVMGLALIPGVELTLVSRGVLQSVEFFLIGARFLG